MKVLKKITLLFFITLILPAFAQTWTQTGDGVTIVDLNSVGFATNDTVIAVGKNGTVLKSTDAGETWVKVNHGLTTKILWAVQFPTANIGYAAGEGTLLKSSNGGNTWSDISGNLPANAKSGSILGMNFKDENNGFLVGNPGLILQTSDGGTTWHSRNTVSSDGYLRSLDYVDETTLYVVGNSGVVKISINGGLTWQDHVPSTEPPAKGYVGLPNTPFGVNLSGAEFGGHYLAQGQPYPGMRGTHYDYPLPWQLDYLKGKGMNLIRFPFRWERIQRELNGELYAEEIQLMKNLINGANERNMKIFIDMHNFGRRGRSEYDLDLIDGNNSPVTRHHLADAWKKLALEFKDLNLWGYDLMNEPHDMANSNSWFIIAQEVIDSIRTVDMNTPIIICGDRWSSAYHWPGSSDNLKNLNDPADKLIYQAHLYFDANESGTYNGTYASENATPQTGVNRATPFVNWLKANNKKGFLGEYGFPVYSDGSKQTDEEKWALVLDNMLKYLQENAVTGTYWSTGTRWGRNKLSADPKDSPDGKSDRPQMLVLEKYKMTNAITTP